MYTNSVDFTGRYLISQICIFFFFGEAKKEVTEGSQGNKSGLEKYRMVEKGIVEIAEKFGVTREEPNLQGS